MFTINTISDLIQSRFSSFVKKGINLSPHFVPLNLKALDRSIGVILNNEYNRSTSTTVGTRSNSPKFNTRAFRDSLYTYIRGKYKDTIVLKGEEFTVNGKRSISLQDLLSKFTPAIVYIGGNGKDNLVGILFNSYSAAQAEVLNGYINKGILKELGGYLEDNKSLDLAYILRNESSSSNGDKIKQLFGIFNSISDNSVNVKGVNIPNDKSSLIQSKMMVESLLKDYSVYQERKLGTYSATLTKEVSNFVNKIRADILIIHDTSSKEEVKKVLESSSFIDKVTSILPRTKVFATTLVDNIRDKLRSIFLGKKPTSPKREVASTKKNIKKDKSSIRVISTKGINSEYVIPPKFKSLLGIQNLLNQNLFSAVSRSMGTGNSHDVLNYRTGRLAKSFEVTAVSQDRQGALTAFFTYMKYPYGTFSKGGAQQHPRTRDPRFLGEVAIRDIAEKLISERLRAVGI